MLISRWLNLILIISILENCIMARNSRAQTRQPAPKIQNLIKGNVGGKTRVPANLQNFTVDQLRGNDGRTLNQLREISKNRALPPVNRQKNPMPLPKVKNT